MSTQPSEAFLEPDLIVLRTLNSRQSLDHTQAGKKIEDIVEGKCFGSHSEMMALMNALEPHVFPEDKRRLDLARKWLAPKPRSA